MNNIINSNTASNKITKEGKLTIVYLLVLLFAFIPTYNHIFDSKIAFLGDNANYYILGKAIANGDGFINAQNVTQTPANSYPPGYPAFIATIITIANDSIVTIKYTNGLLYFASLIVLFFFFKAITDNIHFSFAILFAMLFHYYNLQYSTWMMSEIPFIFFSSLGLLALTKIDTQQAPWKSPWFALMLLSTSFSYYIRSQGIALIGGIGLYYLIHRNWKYMFSYGIGFVSIALPWFIRGLSFKGSPYTAALKYKDYYDRSKGEMDGIGDWIDRIFSNIPRYIESEIPSAIFGTEPDYQNTSMTLGIIIIALIIFGIIKTRKYQIAIAGYILATFAILVLWPSVWIGIRFMMPIVPLMIFLFFYGIFSLVIFILEKIKFNTVKINQYLPYAFILVALIYTPRLEELNKAANTPLNPIYRNYFAMAEWTKSNLGPNTNIICRKNMLFHLFSDHYAHRIINKHDHEAIFKAFKDGKYTHIVYYGSGLGQKYVLPLLQKYPERFKVINKTEKPEVYLMEIIQ
ncbi:MAG: hypothetical protein DRI86_01660 [Bacteroidetes bacterium]|nr:MAG: hypothetical protein DRI86_01660 [Bacteroidota bacterium]